MKVVVLLSGGMDSVCALYHARAEHEVALALSFDYGSKHNAREIPFARRHAGELGVAHQGGDAVEELTDGRAAELLAERRMKGPAKKKR